MTFPKKSPLKPPLLTEEQLGHLGAVTPKIVAFCSGNLAERVDLRPLFERQLLHAAVVSRPSSTKAPASPTGLSRSFDELYQSVTAANLSSWSAQRDNSGPNKVQ